MDKQLPYEEWDTLVTDARAGDNSAGRYLFACAMRLIHQGDPLPPALAEYMAVIMYKALEVPAKEISGVLNIAKTPHRQKGTSRWDNDIATAYIASAFDPFRLSDFLDPECDDRTVKRWLKSDHRAAIDMFHDKKK